MQKPSPTTAAETSRISIIVPACNEEALIRRCIEALVMGAEPDEIEVIVACNGCTDATVEVVRSIEGPIRIVENAVGGKARALNGAEATTGDFPRIYVDADITLSMAAVRALRKALAEPSVLAAAPRMTIDFDGLPWSVRSYYRIWLELPWAKRGPIGSGVYALSREGRARFGRFPDTLAEDAFVDHLFSDEERRCLEEVTFEVRPPRTLRQLVPVLARRRIGTEQLARLLPEERSQSYWRQRRALADLAAQPAMWPALSVYLGVTVAAMLFARLRRTLGLAAHWTRDESTRGRRTEA